MQDEKQTNWHPQTVNVYKNENARIGIQIGCMLGNIQMPPEARADRAEHPADPDRELVDQICWVFYDNEDKAREFVRRARAAKNQTGITWLAAKWVMDGAINGEFCGRGLYEPLSTHGIYTCTESNWNTQIRETIRQMEAEAKLKAR